MWKFLRLWASFLSPLHRTNVPIIIVSHEHTFGRRSTCPSPISAAVSRSSTSPLTAVFRSAWCACWACGTALCGRSASPPARRGRSGSRTFWPRCRSSGGGRREALARPNRDLHLQSPHACQVDPRPLAAGICLHAVRPSGAGV